MLFPLVPKLIDPEDSRSAPKRIPFVSCANRTETPRNVDTVTQQNIKKGEILQSSKKSITEEPTNKRKYLFERRNEPDDLVRVFALDVKPADKGSWLR